jgi:RsmE family RNA methyltransferase
MNVILLEPVERDAVLEGPRAKHVIDVLALGVGQRFRVGILDGPLGTAEILEVLPGPALRLACTWEDAPPPEPRIDLLLALPRPKVLARLLSPIAQLGVRRLMLTGAWKVERFYFDAHVLMPEEHRPKLVEGLAQAKDTRLPVVTVHRSIAHLLDEELDAMVGPAGRVLVDPSAGVPLERAIGRSVDRLVLAVGPEGGWTGRELRHLESRGFSAGSLGDRVLRSDVATVTALARAHATLAAADTG